MQKRKIAIVASGITSPLFNMLEFAERVAQDGWQVQIFAPETARDRIAYSGFAFSVIPEPAIWAYGPLLPDRKNPAHKSDRSDAAVAAFGVDTRAKELSHYAPDLIVVDCELHAHILVSLSLRLPMDHQATVSMLGSKQDQQPLSQNL